ncbi:MAG: hypothetical protein K0R47_1253 [Brevibacillus sp.]|nr:hypothetical protein [Brevibacillus sp.]
MSKWKFKKVVRKRYGRQIWKIATRKGEKGYFKFFVSQKHKDLRILVANEYIAASLAKRLGLPVAKVKKVSVRGPRGIKRKGIVSIRAAGKKVIPWKKAPGKVFRRPHHYVKKADLLAQLVVFDAWIMNPDRTSHNLILYRQKSSKRYKWYLIDHGIALFGKQDQWKLRKAKKAFRRKKQHKFALLSKKGKRLLFPKGLKRFFRANQSAADKMIRKIQRLPRSTIRQAIGKVPKSYLKKTEKKFMTEVLVSRQKRMKKIVMHLT